jgi:hypothetical protein
MRHIIVLELLVDDLPIAIAHVILVLGVHFAKLGSDALSSDNSSEPRLEPNDQIYSAAVPFLYSNLKWAGSLTT